MEGIFFVKKVGELFKVKVNKDEEIDKRYVIITVRECRQSDYGTQAVDQDILVSMYRDLAKNFMLPEGQYISASLHLLVRGNLEVKERQQVFQEIRMSRYCEL